MLCEVIVAYISRGVNHFAGRETWQEIVYFDVKVTEGVDCGIIVTGPFTPAVTCCFVVSTLADFHAN